MIGLYACENKINGKMYIGRTNNVKARFYQHRYISKPYTPIDFAIKKYGEENFNMWVFEYAATREEANVIEKYWIAEMRSCLGINSVYNIDDGGYTGNGRLGKKHSEESKNKMSIANKGNQHNKGKRMSEEQRVKLSIACKGRRLSEETKAKISASLMGNSRKKNKPAHNRNYELDKKMDTIIRLYTVDKMSMGEIAEEMGVAISCIQRRLKAHNVPAR